LDVKAYIESGILEAYVLGALTPEERTRVAADIAANPAVAAEVKAIEEGLFAFAKAGAVAPPAAMKEQIWDAIVKEQSSVSMGGSMAQDNVRPFNPAAVAEKRKQQSWQRAAVWAALVGSLAVNVYFWGQNNSMQQQQVAMQRSMDTMTIAQIAMAQGLDQYRHERDMIADTAMQAVIMKAAAPGQVMAATVYWNKTSGESYLAMQKMPPPPAGMQYQMWVIQDGKPVSMGMIDNDVAKTGGMAPLGMKVTAGQAFAISLEKEGGNPTPTEVKVVGKIS
jgi:anti-sigma-K factor RskA